MVSLSSVVALVLGFFELWLVFKMEILNDFSTLHQLKLFPGIFQSDRSVYLLLCAFTVFLGLVRISWAVSGKTIASWLTVVFAHVAETLFLWNLALLPHFNKNKAHLVDLVQELVAQRHDIPSTVLLFLVPGFVVFFLLCGPNLKKDKDKSKKN